MKYFTIDELTRSTTASKRGIANTPPKEVIENLSALVENVLDPLREAWGGPITVTSGYRSPELNKAVGGSKTSDHMKGFAADITVGSRQGNKRLFQEILDIKLPFKQLIWEKGNSEGPSWVHISYVPQDLRHQILKLK